MDVDQIPTLNQMTIEGQLREVRFLLPLSFFDKSEEDTLEHVSPKTAPLTLLGLIRLRELDRRSQ